MQILEIIATITGIICVYLQTRENILAWPFGILSVTILSYIFLDQKLYSDTILHVIYIGLNIYGWWYWSSGKNQINQTVEIASMTISEKLLSALIIIFGASVWGYFMNRYTDAELAFVDAFTTTGSLAAQYLLSRKVLQNWLIWIVVDVVAVSMYIYKGLYFTSFMFAVFLGLCIKGYFDWRKTYAAQESNV